MDCKAVSILFVAIILGATIMMANAYKKTNIGESMNYMQLNLRDLLSENMNARDLPKYIAVPTQLIIKEICPIMAETKDAKYLADQCQDKFTFETKTFQKVICPNLPEEVAAKFFGGGLCVAK
ncbi:unnamed protein product [Adineta ricciae]|uniref:Uncharacterized protein n=1 Tax=Adineta ricciae TaxID=249248 RepID=A0A815QGK9_ADIRI|nr:unnamed protein product [Adineta ricciae]CAF1676760.1 unnamed protein product [Adineta ricciae]